MQFVNPYFLFGLVAVVIPVIIHLFNFRRFRRVYFTNVRYLQELTQQTQKQSKLKHLLILFTRILAVICIVLAFAQPYVPLGDEALRAKGKAAVSVFVDNSFSMEARGIRGSLLDEARQKAAEVVSAYKPSDLFQLLTNDFEGRHQRLLSREEFTEALDEIKVSPSSRSLQEITARQHDLLNASGTRNRHAYIISDFQASRYQASDVEPDSMVSHYLIPLSSNQTNNLFVDSCWFDSPVRQSGQQVKVIARIRNTSATNFEKIPVKLLINGRQRAVASFDCKANDAKDVPLSFTNYETGIQSGSLEIVDYPVTYDDRFYFSYNVYSSISVLCINDKGLSTYFNALFGADSAFSYTTTNISNLDYSSFDRYQLIILNSPDVISSGLLQELRTFIDNGGTLLVIPPPGMDEANFNVSVRNLASISYAALDTFNTRIGMINAAHPLFRDVFEKIPENIDLPLVLAHYPLVSDARSSTDVLLKMENGDAFLTLSPQGKGSVYFLSVPMDPGYSNFGKHAIFVPALYQMALLSRPQENLYYVIGEEQPVEFRDAVARADQVYKIKMIGSAFEVIPENRQINGRLAFFPHEQIKEAGNYLLMDGANAVLGLSFNYERKESDLNYLTNNEIKSAISKQNLKGFQIISSREKPVYQVIEEMNKGVRYWKLFVLLALGFLLAEILLLRFLK